MASAIPRLKRRAEFLKVAATGRKWVTRGLILQQRRREDDNSPRIGYTVSKKVGNAVRRNKDETDGCTGSRRLPERMPRDAVRRQ